jgi:hypothetical protein
MFVWWALPSALHLKLPSMSVQESTLRIYPDGVWGAS